MYLLSLIGDNGKQADVDIDLSSVDLSTEEGQKELADAVLVAMSEVHDDSGSS